MAKIVLIAPANVTGASVDGKEYHVKKGKIKADAEHCQKLIEMGFVAETEAVDVDEEALLKQMEAEEAERKKLEEEALKNAGVEGDK